MPIFYQKRLISQKHNALILFLKFLMKDPLLSCKIIGKKNAHSVKPTFYCWPKKLIGCPFFRFVTKTTACMSKFRQNTVHSLKNAVALMPIFCKKNVYSLKKRYSHVFF